MRKLFVSLCLTGLLAALSSCKTSQNQASTAADISGEWKITEVNGKSITTQQDGQEAYIGFDTSRKSMSGCAGCNRIFSNFDIDTKKGTISFGDIASTRMMCADMTTEDLVLGAIGKVSRYQTGKDGTLTLKSDDGKTSIKMTKRTDK